MVGFFKMLSISKLTTEGAKLTEPLHQLGMGLSDRGFFDSLNASEKATLIGFGRQLLAMKDVFDTFHKTKNKRYHDDAVKFLVMVAAVIQGADGVPWSWQAVRQFSQGIYCSLVDDPQTFDYRNIPVIAKLSNQTRQLIESAIK